MGFLRRELGGPEPLLGYIAWLLGQTDKPEPLKAADILPLFDRKKIPGHDLVIPGNYWENLKLKNWNFVIPGNYWENLKLKNWN